MRKVAFKTAPGTQSIVPALAVNRYGPNEKPDANEGFGDPYELTNCTAYSEICATISFPMWATRMFKFDPDAEFFDVIERTLYNNLAAGVSLSGDRYFYACPLESDGAFAFNRGWLPDSGKHLPHASGSATPKEWFACACCPPNLARYLPQVPGCIYATRNSDLFVNLFVASEAEVELPSANLKLVQESGYPWDGKVRLLVVEIMPSGGPNTARSTPGVGEVHAAPPHPRLGPRQAGSGGPVPLCGPGNRRDPPHCERPEYRKRPESRQGVCTPGTRVEERGLRRADFADARSPGAGPSERERFGGKDGASARPDSVCLRRGGQRWPRS